MGCLGLPKFLYAIFIDTKAPSGLLQVRGVVYKGLRATQGLCGEGRQHDLEHTCAPHGFTNLSGTYAPGLGSG